jgi:outer membrane lipoprotein-sorting protein
MVRLLLLTASLMVSAAPFARAAASGAEAVQQCVRRNLPERTMRQAVLLESTDAGGAAQRLEAELLWRRTKDDRSQIRITVEAPPDVRGSAFLLLEREGGSDLFSYLPELRTVRRLTGRAISGSLFGTDFSYEDLERIQATAETAAVEQLAESEVDGRKVDVIAATVPPASESAYARVVTYVDRETCVALRTDLEGRPGAAAKQVSATFGEVKKVGERWVPHRVEIEDKETGRRTQLTVRKIDLDVDLPESEFSQTALTKGR